MGTSSKPPVRGPAGAGLTDTADYLEPLTSSPKEAPSSTPHRIGRFVILRRLGQGGLGAVYAAYDEELDRKVAIKLLHESELAGADHRTLLLREAQAMARVSHPNVLHVYEVGEELGRVCIAMELIEGTTLTTWQRTRTWQEILRMYRAAGAGLLAAHRVGLVHRDFKPDNVLVGGDGQPRVADFGLARASGSMEPAPAESRSNPGRLLDAPLTQRGALVGTPAYMSPEQFRGEPADSRSDQFSFCVALYEALYRQLPFGGKDLAALGQSVCRGELRPRPEGSRVPVVIEQALRRGLAVEPDRRFPSMAELLATLDLDPQRDPAAAPRLGRVFSVAMLCIGVLLDALIGLLLGTKLPTVQHLFGGAAALCFGAFVAAWLLRRELQQSEFHRHLVKMVLTLTAQMAAMRGAALLLHLSLVQEGTLEMIATAALLAVATVNYLPTLWPAAVICALAALLIPLFPSWALAIVVTIYPALGLAFIVALDLAAGRAAASGRGLRRSVTPDTLR